MTLTPDQWESVKSLFDSALVCPAEDRTSFVRAHCDDGRVAEEVERLLAHHQEMGSFITAPAVAAIGGTVQPVRDSRLAAGGVLAGRFRIVRFLASGGMGEVYEAEDLELGGPVAIKALRPELADSLFEERFKREVQLAKRVTHPNVCRVYDLFRHTLPGAGERDGWDSHTMLFIAMEFLRGETLATRLHDGPLDPGEALAAARQIAAALDAAHDAGVLHRDLKPGNIMLVPTAKAGPARVVVTDFGLALHSSHAQPGTDGIEGTPAYMSPEQLLGEELTPASDIYSLGLVMYQMATGAHPFEGGERTLFGLTRLTGEVSFPRERRRRPDRRWEAVTLRCLEREPTRRYQVARDVVNALSWRTQPTPSLHRNALYAVLAVAAVALTWLGIRSQLFFSGGVAPTGQRLAVLGFKNEPGRPETAWMSTALSTFLTTDLGTGERLETVPGDEVAGMKADLSLTDSDRLPDEALARIRTRVGADLVVLGSYGQDGRQIRLRLHTLDTKSHRSVWSVERTALPANLIDLFRDAGRDLRKSMHLGQLTHQEEEEVRASLPSNPDALRFYSEGIEKMRHFDAVAAVDELKRAVGADSGYPLGHSALAEAWFTLGYEDKAAAEAKAAFDLSGNLPWRDRQLIEGHYRKIARQWELAADVYRRLWLAFPVDVDYGLLLADVQTSAGRVADALETVGKLKTVASPLHDDPRIDVAEAAASDDLKQKHFAASKAAEKAAARGQRALLAAALRQDGFALNLMGKTSDSISTMTRSQRIYREIGDIGDAGFVALNLATVLRGQASAASRTALIEEALRSFRVIGSRRGEGSALNNLAGVLQEVPDLDAAEKCYRQASEIFGEIGQRHRFAVTRNNLGSIAEERGDLAKALAEYEAALTTFRTLKAKSNIAFELSNIAEVLRFKGDLTAALRDRQEQLAIYRELHYEDSTAQSLWNRAEVFADQGRLSLAKRDYEEALEISRKGGNQNHAAVALGALAEIVMRQGDLAAARRLYDSAPKGTKQDASTEKAKREAAVRILLEEGKLSDAEEIVRRSVQEAHDGHVTLDEGSWRAVLARCLFRERHLPDAQAELDRVGAILRKSPNQVIRFDVLITAALVKAARGTDADRSSALEMLATALQEAKKFGFVGVSLEARLGAAEIEMKLGSAAAGSDLAALKRDAGALGYRLISSKAAKLLQSPSGDVQN